MFASPLFVNLTFLVFQTFLSHGSPYLKLKHIATVSLADQVRLGFHETIFVVCQVIAVLHWNNPYEVFICSIFIMPSV